MSTPVLIACIVTAAVALFLAVAFIKPVKGLFLLILNSAAGWAGLYIFNNLPLALTLPAPPLPVFWVCLA